MTQDFDKHDAHWIYLRYGAHPTRTEHEGRLQVRDNILILGHDLSLPAGAITSGCLKQEESRWVVVLLQWYLFARVELTVDGPDEGHALLAAMGLADPERPMRFDVLTPSAKPAVKALIVNLGGWAILAMAGSALFWGLRSMGYTIPRWLFGLALLPLAVALVGLTSNAYLTPVTLGAEGLALGRAKHRTVFPLSAIGEVQMTLEGVAVELSNGETVHLKTQAAPNAADPVKDVLFGSIMAARDRYRRSIASA